MTTKRLTHTVRRTNPKSKWPFRIVRTRTDGSTHKLNIRFETKEKAEHYLAVFAVEIDRFA